MKKILIVVLTQVLLTSTMQAQQKGEVNGTVRDQARDAIASATISLFTTGDSALAGTSITGKDGRFSFSSLREATYFVSVSAIGYRTGHSQSFTIGNGQTQIVLKDLILESQSAELNTVTVTAPKPLIEIKADKTVMNIAGSINAVGATAMELLQKSPGVRVDKDDNISMNGKNGVRIYIDGKPSQMDGKDLAAILKAMPSSDIEAIEIITNPSAKYDASGNAGIINIRLNKNKSYGLNGNAALTSTFAKTPKYNASVGLNSRNKFSNIFGNYSYHVGEYHNTLNLYREQMNKGQQTVFDQLNTMVDHNNNHNFKVGTDFFLNKKSTLGAMVNGSIINGPWENASRTIISTKEKIDSVLVATNRIDSRKTNFNYNVNYRFADTSGHELNIDADHGAFTNRAGSFQPNRYMNADESIVLSQKTYRNKTPSNIRIYSLKADYEQRFKGGKLGIGTKISQVRTDNDFLFYQVVDGTDKLDVDMTNRFKYSENVNAAYINYNKSIKKWSMQFGVRMEQTRAIGDLTALKGESGKKVDTSYLNLFPSGGITLTINKSNSLGVTYSRRIDRPSYQDLNPFEFKLDELTYEKGNPFLKPQYTDNLQLIHTFKQFLTTSVGYSHVRDFFTYITDTSGGTKTFVTNKNIATQNIYNINISAPLRIRKWWNGYTTLTAFRSEFKGILNNEKLDLGTTSMNFYMEHNFTLSKTWNTEISGFYNAPALEGTTRNKAMWRVDFGVQKKLFDSKGSIKLSVNDIFNSMEWNGKVDFSGLKMRMRNKWESQQLKLAFTYRFGNKNVKGARERNTGLEDETKRIKNGS